MSFFQRLVEEIIKQIRFFRPEPRLIKQRIEDLIGRRYLRREDPMNPASPYMCVRQAFFVVRCSPFAVFYCYACAATSLATARNKTLQEIPIFQRVL